MVNIPVEEARQYIHEMDLGMVGTRLMYKGWMKKQALTAVNQYKRFLFLQKKYGNNQVLVPTEEIDQVWHEHILYTQQYYNDCMHIFGKYFHHDPSIEDPTTKPQNMEFYFEETQRIYFNEYGEHIKSILPKSFIGKIFIRLVNLAKQIGGMNAMVK